MIKRKRNPFEPKNEIPAWKILYDAFHNREYGARITNVEIQELMKDYSGWRGPIYWFVKKLEEKDQKTLRTVRGAGYIMAKPNEHTELGSKRILRARRQAVKGKKTLLATNLNMLSPSEKILLVDMQSKTNRILKAINKRKETVETKVKETDEIKEHLVDIESKFARIQNLLKKKKIAGYA